MVHLKTEQFRFNQDMLFQQIPQVDLINPQTVREWNRNLTPVLVVQVCIYAPLLKGSLAVECS